MTIIDANRVKPRILRLHALLKIIPVTRGFWGPDDFSKSAEAGEDHVLDVFEIGNVFGPNIGLSTKNVPLGLGRQFGRYRFEGVDLFHWEITADGMWLG